MSVLEIPEGLCVTPMSVLEIPEDSCGKPSTQSQVMMHGFGTKAMATTAFPPGTTATTLCVSGSISSEPGKSASERLGCPHSAFVCRVTRPRRLADRLSMCRVALNRANFLEAVGDR